MGRSSQAYSSRGGVRSGRWFPAAIHGLTGGSADLEDDDCLLAVAAAGRALYGRPRLRAPLVALGHRGERCLGFLGHVGVGVAGAIFHDFDDAHAAQIQVALGIVSMGQLPLNEGADEGGVHALRIESVQELAHVGGMLLLIADVVAP